MTQVPTVPMKKSTWILSVRSKKKLQKAEQIFKEEKKNTHRKFGLIYLLQNPSLTTLNGNKKRRGILRGCFFEAFVAFSNCNISPSGKDTFKKKKQTTFLNPNSYSLTFNLIKQLTKNSMVFFPFNSRRRFLFVSILKSQTLNFFWCYRKFLKHLIKGYTLRGKN